MQSQSKGIQDEEEYELLICFWCIRPRIKGRFVRLAPVALAPVAAAGAHESDAAPVGASDGELPSGGEFDGASDASGDSPRTWPLP